MGRIKIGKPEKEKISSFNVENWPIWECEPSNFDWEYDEDEICYILEGKVNVTTDDGEQVEIQKGDLVSFPKGLKCNWDVKEKIRKHYKLG